MSTSAAIRTRWLLGCVVVAALLAVPPLAGQTLKVIGWNAESNFNGADPTVVATRMAYVEGCDIWGMCEVKNQAWAAEFEHAAELGESADFKHVLGSTGGNIKLLIVYNHAKLEKVSHEELHGINVGNHRAPLVAKFKIRATNDEFLFMVNHLARGDSALRHQQAAQLKQWAQTTTLPIIAVGDYNFDWDYRKGATDHDQGYDNMTAGNVFKWVRPPVLVRTQASDYDGVLDFVFVANKPAGWKASSFIMREPGDFPDNVATPDHRPILGTFVIHESEMEFRQQVLARIQQLETELAALKALVQTP